jgi:hypothetical protein
MHTTSTFYCVPKSGNFLNILLHKFSHHLTIFSINHYKITMWFMINDFLKLYYTKSPTHCHLQIKLQSFTNKQLSFHIFNPSPSSSSPIKGIHRSYNSLNSIFCKKNNILVARYYLNSKTEMLQWIATNVCRIR